MRRFLGITAYFRKFIEKFLILAKPLKDLTRKVRYFQFGKRQIQAFEALKAALTSAPIFAIYNPRDETALHTDVSSLGFGAVLLQRKADRKPHPVLFFSKRSIEVESRYHSFELATLAIVYALKRNRVYLLGIPFKIITDCKSLKLTLEKEEINTRIARWALEF